MKKRVAYIGISYPLLYDYRHQANKSLNDLSDSPNPIIESVCPNNMRNLPYVKFVDELYPNFDFHRISEYTKENENDMSNLGLIEPPVRY